MTKHNIGSREIKKLERLLEKVRDEGCMRIAPLIKSGELEYLERNEHSEYPHDYESAWQYLEFYELCGAGDEICYEQGRFDGVCEVLRILGIECKY